jgi:predicted permease
VTRDASHGPRPPRLARAVLRAALPGDARGHVPIELDEVFRRRSARHGALRARLWYWREALSFGWHFLRERQRKGPMRLLLDATARDFAHALRRLAHAPGFTAVTVLTLALAIGANTAIFSVVDAVLINPLSLPDPDRLVSIRVTAPGSELQGTFGVSPEFYFQYRDRADKLEHVGMYRSAQTTVRTADRVDRLFVTQGTTSLFATLGARPVLGRLPTVDDERANPPVMLISHNLWRTWFNGEPNVVGRTFEAANAQRTVIGVMGPEFRFPTARFDVWFIGALDEKRVTPGQFNFNLIGRMKTGVTVPEVASQLDVVAQELPARFGGSAGYARIIEKHRADVRPQEDLLVGGVSTPIWILLGTVGIVLLVACANVANLFMVRTESRRRDLAMRLALGASRARLLRAQLAEALTLSALGGIGGVLIAWAGVPLLVRLAPENLPNLDLVAVNPTVLAFSAGISALAALFFGLAPAVRFSRPDGTAELRHGAGTASPGRRIVRHALVVVQTALALLLLVGAGLLARSFFALNLVNPGFSTEDIFTFQVAPARDSGLNDPASFARFHHGLMARLAALPGVQSVGLVNELPLDEGAGSARFAPEEAEASDNGKPMSFTFAAGDYFKTMAIPVVKGRLFTDSDHAGSDSALVSQSAAERLWPGQDPIGKRFRFATQSTWTSLTVVGVVGDVRLSSYRQPTGNPMAYMPLLGPTPQSWGVGTPAYVVKTARTDMIGADIRNLLREVAPGAPMYRVFTMEALASRSMASLSFTMVTIAVAAGLALVLGMVGLYGVLSYVVAQRTREIAVRMALGAHASALRRMVVLQAARVTLIGVAVGLAAALALTRVLETLLFGVAPLDTMTFAGVSLLMVTVAFVASYMPARRASSVDPLQALRES